MKWLTTHPGSLSHTLLSSTCRCIESYQLWISFLTTRNLVFSGSSFLLSILQTSATQLCLPMSFIWEVMWHWTEKVLNLYGLEQKRHLGWSLSRTPECFLTRSSSQNGLRSSSSVRCSGTVVRIFCISTSSNPFYFPSLISSKLPSGWNFGTKKLRSENCDMTSSWRGGRGCRYTKFEVNRTNISWVKLPVDPSVSSGILVLDVRLTSVDVRADVTTKTLTLTLYPFRICDTNKWNWYWQDTWLPPTEHYYH